MTQVWLMEKLMSFYSNKQDKKLQKQHHYSTVSTSTTLSSFTWCFPLFRCARVVLPLLTGLSMRLRRSLIQINSNKPNGVYGIGEEILIDVYLSTPVVSDDPSEYAS